MQIQLWTYTHRFLEIIDHFPFNICRFSLQMTYYSSKKATTSNLWFLKVLIEIFENIKNFLYWEKLFSFLNNYIRWHFFPTTRSWLVLAYFFNIWFMTLKSTYWKSERKEFTNMDIIVRSASEKGMCLLRCGEKSANLAKMTKPK